MWPVGALEPEIVEYYERGREAGRTRSHNENPRVLGHYFLKVSGRRLRQMIKPAIMESTPIATYVIH